MTDVTIRTERRGDGVHLHVCGRTTTGIDWTPEGCTHRTPREAIDHAKALRTGRIPIRGDWDDLPWLDG